MNRGTLALSVIALAAGVAAGRFLGGGDASGTGAANATSTSSPTAVTTPQAIATAFGEENKAISRVFAALQGSDSEARSGLYEAIQQLTPEELEKVRQIMKRIPASFANQLRPSLLEQWARLNPAEAAMHVREMPESGRFNDHDGIASAWALTNPELALAEASRLGMNSGKATFLRRAAIEALGRRDPAVAMDQVEALLDCPERDSLLSMTSVALARKDATAASNWLAARLPKLKIGAEGSELVNNTLAAIAGKDPGRAKAQVESLPELLRKGAANAVGTEIVNYDPRGGLQYCAENGIFAAAADDDRNSGRNDAFETAIRRDREQTVAWTLEQPAGAIRDFGLSRLMRSSKEAGEVSKHFALMTPEAQSQNVEQAVQSYGNYAKFDEAVRWVEGMGDEAMRARGTVALIYSKGGANTQEVLGWLEKMPAGNVREDGAVSLFTSQNQRSFQTQEGATSANPDMTNKIFAMISSPEKRQQAAMQGYYQQGYGGPARLEKANTWLDALPGLTAEQKAQIKQNASSQLQFR